ncbi:MAG: hypothetical protein ABI639_00415 [Thermoanaerobaculia bacterium]
MNRMSKLLTLGCLALVFASCQQRTDKTDSGGVLLSITDFDGLPVSVSANASGDFAQIGSLTVSNIAADPSGTTSDLMNVEIQSYEVTFTRADAGTRVPPRLVNFIFGIAPVNGTFVLLNGPFMRADQFNTQPILDLKNNGVDGETGSRLIRLNVGIRFFGHTLAGKAVESQTAIFTMEVTP